MTNPPDALRGSAHGTARVLSDDDVDVLVAGSDGSWDDGEDDLPAPESDEAEIDEDEEEGESEDDE